MKFLDRLSANLIRNALETMPGATGEPLLCPEKTGKRRKLDDYQGDMALDR
jgi:hypothetical protein